jgi:CYTH domain-containing protein
MTIDTQGPTSSGETTFEIEHKFLLRGIPEIPRDLRDQTQALTIEQGYLAPLPQGEHSIHLNQQSTVAWGRLRKTIKPDGSTMYHHTMKTGIGKVRRETERVITPEQFQEHWPRTIARRLKKIRHRVPDPSGLVWEIDVFSGVDLVLAEIELPTAETTFEIPAWLKPWIVREVTLEAAYSNSAIAARLTGG